MLRATLALAFVLTLSACDSTSDPATQLDPLSEGLLRATSRVPDFGGVELEGERVTVYTLGDIAAARAAVTSIFGDDTAVNVENRPAQGQGSEGLKDRASAVLFSTENGTVSADYDETTGYVRIGVRDAESVRRTLRALRASDLPQAEIILQVELPVVAL